MPQIKPSRRDEQPDDNPYAPPRTEIRPAVDEKATDQVWNQRKKHLRRESCIRIAGLIGLILAGCVVLTFGLGTLTELYRQEEEGIELWMYRRWVARMIVRYLNRRPRIRHQLGLVPAPELGAVGSDYGDNATRSGARLRLALAESHSKPRANICGFDRFVRDVRTILSAPTFPHVVSKGQDGILS